jgi:hypothetical protein
MGRPRRTSSRAFPGLDAVDHCGSTCHGDAKRHVHPGLHTIQERRVGHFEAHRHRVHEPRDRIVLDPHVIFQELCDRAGPS